ncbi:UNVERIFIED_CONTAM: hypothetical protein DES50_101593 [Williamsia faeni]
MRIMTSPDRQGAEAEQARYFATELKHWIDKIVLEIGRGGKRATGTTAKRHELSDLHRQLKALRDSFPGAFM